MTSGAQGREAEERLDRVGRPGRKECGQGSGPTADTVSSGEAHSVSPTAQAWDAVSKVQTQRSSSSWCEHRELILLRMCWEPGSTRCSFPVLPTLAHEDFKTQIH